MKATIQCDFDGTIIMNNLSILLREQFASSEWKAIEAEYLAGRLTVEESNWRQFILIKESRRVLESFVLQNIKVRPGFLDFVKYCHIDGLRLVVVSVGLDFYIETVLNNIGLPEVEIYCARTVFGQDGITVLYVDPEGYPVKDGFKRRCLTWLRKQGYPVVYIGDGLSDLDVAKAADQVFATGHLHSLLDEASVPHYSFSSFTEVIRRMNRFQMLK